MSDKTAMHTVEVYTADRYLFQKIRLILQESASVTLGDCGAPDPIRIVDIDTAGRFPDGNFISMSRTQKDADIAIPFSIDLLHRLLSEAKEDTPLSLSPGERSVYLRGEKIRLTEVEYNLMSALYQAGGEYTGREELMRLVWDTYTDPGILNVYIHYLREKLEVCGEKIILSSRKCGYKISEKYIGGGKTGNA